MEGTSKSVRTLAQLHPFHAPLCSDVAAANATANGTDAAHAHRRLASGTCSDSGYKYGAELWFMFLIMFGAMAIMEFVPKIPKPKWVKDAPMPLKIAKGIGIALLELPSSLLSIIFAWCARKRARTAG